MTDADKVALIDKMIIDFWEYNEAEEQERSAMCMLTAISSVANFGNGAEK